MAIALATGYDMDIYTVGRDGTNPTPITRSGAYEFFPAWSPNGQYIAFVSDRPTCPSWIPGEPGTCDGTDAPPPRGGQLFIVEVATGELTQLGDAFITEPPRWINERQIAFSSGEPALGDPGRSLWLVDIFERRPREFRLADGTDTPIKLSESWSPGGSQILFQAANGDTEVVLSNADGSVVGRFSDLTFSRYGMAASWSPDGTRIVLSHHRGQGSEIFTLPAAGGEPVPVTRHAPSWWHGWSPDGARLAYVAARGGSRVVDVYTIGVEGGEEQRLTYGEGHCDGPDYSADGARIYYNCDRGGHAQIWVMAVDGTGQRQVFEDDTVNWFPHPSPDGETLVYLAYPSGTTGHPADLPVALVLCDTEGRERRVVRKFIGGQGTINVPSWAPDGRAFAYVRYEP